MGDRGDNDNYLIERQPALFSRFWKSRVASPNEVFDLDIDNLKFGFRSKSVNGWALEITFRWNTFGGRSFNCLLKEMLDRMASEGNFPNLRAFSPDGWLSLSHATPNWLPTYMSHSRGS
jgi:hypothetical protein